MNEAQSLHAKGDIKASHKKFATRSNGKRISLGLRIQSTDTTQAFSFSRDNHLEDIHFRLLANDGVRKCSNGWLTNFFRC